MSLCFFLCFSISFQLAYCDIPRFSTEEIVRSQYSDQKLAGDLNGLVIRENIEKGVTIGQLSGSDPDRTDVTYGMDSSDLNGVLSVNSQNGFVIMGAALDRESKDKLDVVFTISSGGSTTKSAVEFIISDINDEKPEFLETITFGGVSYTKPYEITVNEDTNVGTALFEVKATDKDIGQNAALSYSIISEEPSPNFFKLRPDNFIELQKELDFEQITRFTLIVEATDSGVPALSSQTTVTMVVSDVQDSPPVFSTDNPSFDVPENSNIGRLIGTIKAEDGDTANSHQIEYSILEGNTDLFEIGQTSGEITVKEPFDREETPYVTMEEFKLTIKATEVSAEGNFSTTFVEIKIEDVNDNPPLFNQQNFYSTLNEDAYDKAALGNITMIVTDKDLSQNSKFFITTEGNDKSYFTISPTQGEGTTQLSVLLTQTVDYEVTESLQLTIFAKDLGNPQLQSSANLYVEIVNINDNVPRITGAILPDGTALSQREIYDAEIRENSPIGTTVITFSAEDDDKGKFGLIEFSLNPVNSLFNIYENGSILLGDDLDYDKLFADTIELIVSVRDQADIPNVSNVKLEVKVIDENDFAPVFQQTTYNFIRTEEVNYNSKTNAIGKLIVVDEDRGGTTNPNAYVQFEIINSEFSQLFYVSSDGGGSFYECYIFTTSPIDLEITDQTTIQLQIRAFDAGVPSLSSIANVSVLFEDVNDNTPYFLQSVYKAEIEESAPFGYEILKVKAVDDDISDDFGNSSISYSLTSVGIPFLIGRSSGTLTVGSSLDYETSSSRNYVLSIQAKDSSQRPDDSKSADTTVEISVLDVNDNDPVWESVDSLVVSEDTLPGTTISTIKVEDLDVNDNVLFNITNLQSPFAVKEGPTVGTQHSCEIILQEQIDFDVASTSNSYQLDIIAYNSEPSKPHQGSPNVDGQSTISIIINIQDVNDNAPEFTEQSYEFHVNENEALDFVIGKTPATDIDSGDNADLIFFSNNIIFQYDGNQLVLKGAIDREITDRYILDVTVFDQPALIKALNDSATVTVIVDDANDNMPFWTTTNVVVEIPENLPEGTPVYQVNASDKDIGNNAKLSYSLRQTNPFYSINATAGVISTTERIIDNEESDDYFKELVSKLQVQVADNGNPRLIATNPFVITFIVIDENDNDPQIISDLSNPWVIPENQDVASTEYELDVIDADEGIFGNVSISIINAYPTQGFDYFEMKGHVVKTIKQFDRETSDVFTIELQAMDGGGRKTSKNLTVLVEDKNDNPSKFSFSQYDVSVYENIERFEEIIDLETTDPDLPGNSQVVFNLENSEMEAFFRIDPITGVIDTVSKLDRETQDKFNLRVSARNGGFLEETLVVVTLMDVNDVVPHFEEIISQYLLDDGITVPENLNVGSIVCQIVALDEDSFPNNKILYRFSDDSISTFKINASGFVLLDVALDRETQDLYSFTVLFSNPNSTQFNDVNLRIIVSDVNDNIPEFTNASYTGRVSEGSATNTIIVVVQANDEDSGPSAAINYTLVTNISKFAIDSQTGYITLQGELDFENIPKYSFQVMAMDQAEPFNRAYATVYVQVVNTNDVPPQFSNDTYVAHISESAAIGTIVVTVYAAQEAGITDPISYEFDLNTRNDARQHFSLNSTSGEITLIETLDYEDQFYREFALTVVATENGLSNVFAGVKLFVKDVNDNPPVFQSSSDSEISISEDVKSAITIGSVLATDADEDGLQKIEYSYQVLNCSKNYELVPCAGCFMVTRDGGEILTTKTIDYEDIDTCFLQVIASDTVLESTPFIVNIEILDVNDNSPEVIGIYPSSQFTVKEDFPTDSLLCNITARDADSGRNGNFRFFLTTNNNMFRIDISTGEIFTLSTPFDREQKADYTLVIRISDEGEVPRSILTMINITVEDINDNQPQFTKETYIVRNINEGTEVIGEIISTVTAIDKDETDTVVYNISGGNIDSVFDIFPQNGSIYVVKKLDREVLGESAVYELTVTAYDGKFLSATQVDIFIADINDNAPVFTDFSGSDFKGFYGPFKVTEQQLSPFVGTVRAYDPDDKVQSNNGRFEFSLENDYGLFEINPTYGDVQVMQSKRLDREKQAFYNLTIIASDKGTPPLSSFCDFLIAVDDINDEDPRFDASIPAIFRIPENYTESLIGLNVTATDADDGVNALITYSIESNGPFSIDSESGAISLKGILDREVKEEYELTITASDSGVNSRQKTFDLIIVVIDINDNPPEFIGSLDNFEVSEDAVAFTIIGRIQTRDLDISDNILFLEILNSQSIFGIQRIDNFTFSLVIINSSFLDREVEPRVIVELKLFDLEAHSKYSNATIHLLDANDNTPIWLNLDNTISVSEDAHIGDKVYEALASDVDEGQNQVINYKILEGSLDYFTISSDTGELQVSKRLDRETYSTYTLSLEARDRGSTPLYTIGQLIIIIQDINDSPPIFSPSSASESIFENSINSFIYTFSASDADNDSLISYKIQDIKAMFKSERIIDSRINSWLALSKYSGELRTTSVGIDREIADELTLEIVAIDENQVVGSGHSLSYFVLEIVVEDVNDNLPVFEIMSYETDVTENSDDIAVLIFTASDADENAEIKYRIENETLGLFVIRNPAEGIVYLNGSLDYEVVQKIEFVLVACDGNSPSRCSYQDAIINVDNLNDNAPVFNQSVYEVDVKEDKKPVYDVIQLKALDKDIGKFGKIKYTLSRDNTPFRIDPDSGIISLQQAIDFEIQPKYTLTVIARDNPDSADSFRQASTEIIINVIDVNDHKPIFMQSQYSQTFNNIPTVGEFIIQVTATDADSQLYGRITYEILSSQSVPFKINNETGNITVANTLSPSIKEYTMKVKAYNLDKPTKHSEVRVTITIIKGNEAPKFYTNTSASISEDAAPYTHVTTIIARDPDALNNNENVITYSIINTNSVPFILNKTTGELLTSEALDYESETTYALSIEAEDNLGTSSRTTISIFIIDVFDELPEFTTVYTFSIAENSTANSIIGTVTATDPDQNDVIYYFLVCETIIDIFGVDKTSGQVKLIHQLDRENIDSHLVTIKATNNISYQWDNSSCSFEKTDRTVAIVTITVEDINDNAPVFSRQSYTAGLVASAAYGTSVIRVEATDADKEGNNEISFSILNVKYDLNPSISYLSNRIVSINPTTGDIKTDVGYVNFVQGAFEIEVMATDGINNSTSTVDLYVLRNDQRVKIILDVPPDEAENIEQLLIETLSNITGAIVNVDSIESHRVEASTYDSQKSDILIHCVDPETNMIMDVSEVLNLIDKNKANLVKLYSEYHIQDIEPAVVNESELSTLEIAFLVTSVFIFLVALVFLLLLFFLAAASKKKVQKYMFQRFKEQEANEIDKQFPGTNKHTYDGSNPLWNNTMHSQHVDDNDNAEVISRNNIEIAKNSFTPESLRIFESLDTPIPSPKVENHHSRNYFKRDSAFYKL